MSDAKAELVVEAASLLMRGQHASGGWGWKAGQAANTECTSLAVLALHAHGADRAATAPLRRGVAWLHSRQRADGSWPHGDQVPDSSWMTSLSVLSLARLDPHDPHALRGAGWLLERRSRGHTLMQRLMVRLFARDRVVEQDANLIGWPWTADTTAWVEPTAWSLLAIKQLRTALPARLTAERISQAELMLGDRMCRGGGWNYGNSVVMGAELPPYPDTTAIALIALQDKPSAEVTGSSLDRLQEMVPANRTTLVLSLALLCRQLYGGNAAAARADLQQHVRAAGLPGDSRTLSLLLLALDDGTVHFQLSSDA